MRKYLLNVLFIGFVIILVVGGINRTLAQAVTPLLGNANGENSGYGAGNKINEANPPAHGEGNLFSTVIEPIIIEGIIVEAGSHGLELRTADGEMIEVTGRGWRYAQEQGFSAQKGDPLRLETYMGSNEQLEILSIENINNHMQVTLRGNNGEPMWSGRGNQQHPP